ncbi:phage tail sheath subtilisin-like domain-containing protein [Stieleria varia]|uniref:Phage tail sheath protein n=1 Tax=Stieleria varia TaxID=2528005 RepID=A0A5C5ZX69_9BACT|nr:phage tail sheath subtilisin-like domain-containing protein [Stieleria varia]TWT91735.1 Phage tail sheath protein [Stieleria varia]
MPQYFSPGVYVEEVDSGPRPIQGVSTSVAGMVGVTQRGPTSGKPVLVTSFNEFMSTFGGFLDTPDEATISSGGWDDPTGEGGYWWRFPHAVKGFFDNGGQQLYVKRVFAKPQSSGKGAQASSGTLTKGVAIDLVRDCKKGALEIKLAHLIGVEVGKEFAITMQGSTVAVPDEAGNAKFVVQAYDPSTNTVRFENGKGVGQSLSVKDGYSAEIETIQQVAANPTLQFTAKALGAWGDQMHVRVQPMVAATLSLQFSDTEDANPVSTTLAADVTEPVAPATTWTIETVDDLNDKDVVVIQGKRFTLTMVDAANHKKFTVENGEKWNKGTAVRKIRKANKADAATGSTTIKVASSDRLYKGAIVELDNLKKKERFVVEAAKEGIVTLSSATEEQYLEGDYVRLIEATVQIQSRVGDTILAEEEFSSLRLTKETDTNSIVYRIKDRSALVSVKNLGSPEVTDIANFPIATNGRTQPLKEGKDNFQDLKVEDFVGEDGGSGKRSGIQALEDIDDISLVVVPGIWSPVVRAATIQHCEMMKYRFAILDPPPRLSIEGVRAYRTPIDTRYAALYYPWIRLRDPSTSTNIEVPPSGHLAGLYARVDTERGVHKAPANEILNGILPANPVTGVGGLLQDVTKREQDLLNPEGINALRFFPGRGQRVWGARTVSSDSNFKYVNVRRIFNFIERSIDEGTQFVVFEPNDSQLWSRVRQTINNFLNTQWRSGMLEGRTAEEAYYVACDRGVTMQQDDIENGRLICEVGIAPVFPAEFVIFRIQKFTADSKLA